MEDRTWTLHWYTRAAFRALADAAGLRTEAVLDHAGVSTSVLRPA